MENPLKMCPSSAPGRVFPSCWESRQFLSEKLTVVLPSASLAAFCSRVRTQTDAVGGADEPQIQKFISEATMQELGPWENIWYFGQSIKLRSPLIQNKEPRDGAC